MGQVARGISVQRRMLRILSVDGMLCSSAKTRLDRLAEGRQGGGWIAIAWALIDSVVSRETNTARKVTVEVLY